MRLIRRINRETDYRKCDYCGRVYEQQFVLALGRTHCCLICLDLKLSDHEQSVGVSRGCVDSFAGTAR